YAYRLHAEYESACTQAGFRVGAARRAANAAAGDAERAAHLARAATEERRYRESRRRLREHRERMRREGFVPPPLTTHLPDVGDERGAGRPRRPPPGGRRPGPARGTRWDGRCHPAPPRARGGLTGRAHGEVGEA